MVLALGFSTLNLFSDDVPPNKVDTPVPSIWELQSEALKDGFQKTTALTEGVVTWVSETPGKPFYIQDKTGGIQVSAPQSPSPAIGDVIEVQGTLDRGDFAPTILEANITFLGKGPLPIAHATQGGDYLRGAYSGMRALIDGWGRSANFIAPGILEVVLDAGGARIPVRISNAEGLDPQALIADKIRCQGVVCPLKERRKEHQLLAVQVLCNGPADVRVDGHYLSDPLRLPIIPIRDVFQFGSGQTRKIRKHVLGQVIYKEDDLLYINDGDCGLAVRSSINPAIQPGDWVDAVGFPDIEDELPVLLDAEVSASNKKEDAIQPKELPISELMEGMHHADYVFVKGSLIEQMVIPFHNSVSHEDASQNILVLALQNGTSIFTAELLLGPRNDGPKLEIGSVLGIRGISLAQTDISGNVSGFKIRVLGNDSIQVIHPAPFLTVGRLLELLSVSLFALLLVTILALWFARRNMQLQAITIERDAIAAERSRLARDLHDTLEQGLTGIHLHLHSLQPLLPADGNSSNSTTLRERLETVRSLVKQCHNEIRHSIWNLRSPILDEFDLGKALDRSARSLVLGSNIVVTLTERRDLKKIPTDIEDNLLRIGQEALTNAVKHANASKLDISLQVTAAQITMTITDDGHGTSVTLDPKIREPNRIGGFGITGMQERAARIRGTLSINNNPGGGSSVCVSVPLTN